MDPEATDRAVWFLEVIVKPTVLEATTQQADVRRGLLAAMVVNHLADYICWAEIRTGKSKEVERFLSDLSALSAPFAIVREVANATKHAVLRQRDGTPYCIHPANVDAVHTELLSGHGDAHGTSPHGALPWHELEIVMVGRPNGPDLMLHCVVQEAMWFLEKRLNAVIDGYT